MSANIQVAVGSLNPAVKATIANGQQLSGILSLNGMSLVGMMMPSQLTGTAITFQASIDGTNFFDVYNAAGQVSYTVAASRFIAVDPKDFQGIQYLKLKSGSAEGAARDIYCAMKGLS